MTLQPVFRVFAHHPLSGHRRNFLVEAPDHVTAKAVFLVDRAGWEPEICRPAQCFASGEHEGELSVWVGKEDKTAVLCQHHGENPS